MDSRWFYPPTSTPAKRRALWPGLASRTLSSLRSLLAFGTEGLCAWAGIFPPAWRYGRAGSQHVQHHVQGRCLSQVPIKSIKQGQSQLTAPLQTRLGHAIGQPPAERPVLYTPVLCSWSTSCCLWVAHVASLNSSSTPAPPKHGDGVLEN